eukprot:g3488.t1
MIYPSPSKLLQHCLYLLIGPAWIFLPDIKAGILESKPGDQGQTLVPSSPMSVGVKTLGFPEPSNDFFHLLSRLDECHLFAVNLFLDVVCFIPQSVCVYVIIQPLRHPFACNACKFYVINMQAQHLRGRLKEQKSSLIQTRASKSGSLPSKYGVKKKKRKRRLRLALYAAECEEIFKEMDGHKDVLPKDPHPFDATYERTFGNGQTHVPGRKKRRQLKNLHHPGAIKVLMPVAAAALAVKKQEKKEYVIVSDSDDDDDEGSRNMPKLLAPQARAAAARQAWLSEVDNIEHELDRINEQFESYKKQKHIATSTIRHGEAVCVKIIVAITVPASCWYE